MIKLNIYCSVLIIGNVEVGLDIGLKFHQEVMEIVSYDTILSIFTMGGLGYLTPFSCECPVQTEVLSGQDVLSCLFSWIDIHYGSVLLCGTPCTLHSWLHISALAGALAFHTSYTSLPFLGVF